MTVSSDPPVVEAALRRQLQRVGCRIGVDGARPGEFDHDRQQAVRLVPERAVGADTHAYCLGLEQQERRGWRRSAPALLGSATFLGAALPRCD